MWKGRNMAKKVKLTAPVVKEPEVKPALVTGGSGPGLDLAGALAGIVTELRQLNRLVSIFGERMSVAQARAVEPKAGPALSWSNPESKPEPEPEPKKAAPKKEPVPADVAKATLEAAGKVGAPKVRALLKQFGVVKASELPEGDRPAYLAALAELA
jgi:hypothetical protein